MEGNNQHSKGSWKAPSALGVTLGVVIGVVIGIFIENIALGIGVGIAIGVGLEGVRIAFDDVDSSRNK